MKLKKHFFKYIQRFPIVAALLTQVICLIILRNLFIHLHIHLDGWIFVLVQAVFSAFISITIFKLPKWFLYISFLIPVSIFTAFNYVSFGRSVYGITFIILAFSFSHTLKERVPLYLSNNTTHLALIKFINDNNIKTFIDLGSGVGGVVRAVSLTDVQATGVESAPLLFAISFLLSAITGKGKILRKNIWNTRFQKYQLVYAFLSPAIMEKLFIKVKKEMQPGTFFITNSFMVENHEPDSVLELDDNRSTKLYIYKI